jgi:galactose-1-phosphate uridylyltransferase
MNPTIAFHKEIKQGRQYDPRRQFALSTIESEVRYDPLTGNSGRLCHFVFQTPPPTDLQALITASAAQCPFCPDKVLNVTPRFPEDLVPEGRIRQGQAVLFPNLFPYDDISAIAVLSSRHFHPMDDMPVPMIEDGLRIARDFFRRLEARPADGSRPAYGIVTWNYMPPAGASQVHPHLQVIHTTTPGNGLRRELAAEIAYRERHGRCYWQDLLAAEQREGARWIGASGSVLWYTPFVPTGLLGDCVAVFPERATLAAVDDAEITDFARGLRRVLQYFAGRGLWSFNMSLFPAPVGADARYHWLTARLVPRFFLNAQWHVSDVAYLPLLLDERLSMVYPEETAAGLRAAGVGGA